MFEKLISILAITLVFSGCNDSTDNPKTVSIPAAVTPIINYENIHSYPHDITSFTEGFLIHENQLFESTGATEGLPQTRSLFGIVNLANGKIDIKAEIDKEKYFGEGIAFLNEKVFQLTYKTKIGFIYNAKTFKKTGEFAIPANEGWGLTTDGTYLIMSDGTNMLTYIDPTTLQVIKTITVTENGYAKDHLNELEYIKGYIYANIWTTNTIVKINPADGRIAGVLDLTALDQEANRIYQGSQEMNGIAYDSVADKVYVTGKLWPKIYEIKFEH